MTPVLAPRLSRSAVGITLVRWLTIVGARVRHREVIAVVETEKVSAELESPCTGIVVTQPVRAGDFVAIGAVLATIQEESF